MSCLQFYLNNTALLTRLLLFMQHLTISPDSPCGRYSDSVYKVFASCMFRPRDEDEERLFEQTLRTLVLLYRPFEVILSVIYLLNI